MHVRTHSYFKAEIHRENCRLYTKMHVVLCSVLRRGFYNWHDVIWAQKKLEVIAQSDNRGLAVWGASQGQG